MAHCSICGKDIGLLSLEYKCARCRKITCSNCVATPNLLYKNMYSYFGLVDYNFENCISRFFDATCCSRCSELLNSYDDIITKAKECVNNIKVFSKNYHGKIIKGTNKEIHITTPYFDDKDEAMEFLQWIAAYYKYTLVYNVGYTKDTMQNNNYVFSVWSGYGIAAK